MLVESRESLIGTSIWPAGCWLTRSVKTLLYDFI